MIEPLPHREICVVCGKMIGVDMPYYVLDNVIKKSTHYVHGFCLKQPKIVRMNITIEDA